MTLRSHTIEVGQLTTRADVVPGSLNEEARTVDVVWTTGARVKRYSWSDGPWYEELSTDSAHVRMGRLQSGRAPVLLQHDSYDPNAHQGVVASARMEGGKGIATLRFLKDDPDADKTWNKIRQGVLTSVSVGYKTHRLEKVEEIDGVAVMRATDWEPMEISPVSMPADEGAHMRSANERTNSCEVITRQEENKMPEDVKPPAPANEAGQPPPPAPADAARAVAADRERQAAIRAMVRKVGLDEQMADKLGADGTSLDAARAAVLEKLMERTQQNPTSSHVRIDGGEDERDKRLRGMSAWLLERVHAVPMIEEAQKSKRFGSKFKDVALDGGAFRGMSLVDLARECLERSGVSTRGMDRMALVGRAFTHRDGSMQTTSDFGVLFENVMHKVLLAAYAVTPDTWRQFCGTDTVSDFRPHNRFRNGSFGTLDELGEHGEYKRKAIPDGQKSTIETDTRGNIIALTRQAIINDDLGAFVDLATRFGRAAGLSIEVDVYALLTANSGLGATFNGNPFFHASKANINTTGSALSVSGIDADAVVMAQQKDISNNEYLELQPYALVVPRGLRGEALVINEAQFEPTDNKFQKPNRVRGMFTNVVGTVRLTGTRRYLFADPAVAPAIKVVFLEGSGEAPMLESKDGWNIDGTEWKLRMDFLVQFFDPKGAVTNAGQ